MNRPWLLSLALVALPIAAHAAETGEIRGKVTGPDGAPLIAATVIVTGPTIAGEIEVETDDSGEFRIPTAPPGNHDIVFLANGMDPARSTVTVTLDQSTFVAMTLKAKTQAIEDLSMDELLLLDTIVVEEVLPVIDATRSSFSASLGDELLQNLPVGRSYQDAVNMLPGVAGRVDTSQGGPGDGNPSVRGEGQYGNNYLVDGVSTRDPATKTFGSDVNFDAIEDIQVYTDGAPAEYGQFAGMVVNVVTKDGGDEHHGSAGYWLRAPAYLKSTYLIADLSLGEEVDTAKRKFLDQEFSATFGGPIVKEKLWYFGAINGDMGRSVYEGMSPDAPNQTLGGDGFVKLSWFATPDLTLRLVVNGGTSEENNAETSSQFLPGSQTHRQQATLSTMLTGSLQPDASTDIEIKAGWWRTSLDVAPQSGDEDAPSITDLDTGQYVGNGTDFDLNRRGRLGGGASVTRIVKGVLGEHKFKAGGEFWSVVDARNLVYTGAGEGVSYFAYASAGYPCEAADFSDCYAKTNYKEVGWLGHRAAQTALYLQDDWRVLDTLTLNFGARVDTEALFQNEKKPVTMDDPSTEEVEELPYRMLMPAPRLGLAWDVTGDSKTLVTAFAGRYYDIAGNGLADWADTRSAASFTELCNADRAGDPTDDCANGEDVGDAGWLQTYQQDPVANPLIYSSKLKPARMDKITLGFERELFPLFSVGVRGILSQTVNIPEDINYDDASWFIEPSKQKRRDYRALELTAEKKFDDRWQLLAAYTLSESKGTNPGQFETASGGSIGSDGNNVGVFMDDIGDPATRQGYFDAGYGWVLDGLSGLGRKGDSEGWYGYLPYQSFHAVKINGSYTFPFGTTLGMVYEFDSGRAWQKRTLVDLYGDYYGFGEGRGTRFMPPVNYVDVRVAHKLSLSPDQNVEVTVDIFNLPDLQAPVSYYENDDPNFGLTLYRQAPREIRIGIRGTY